MSAPGPTDVLARDREILATRARRLATVVDAAADPNPAAGVTAILVEVADQSYAFPLADVGRAAVVTAVTELPHVPPIVLGIAIIDGHPLAVFDARTWAGRDRRSSLVHIPVLVLGGEREPLALAVDRFTGSLAIPAARGGAGWLQEVTDRGVLVVRTAAFVRDPAFSLVRTAEGTP